MKLSRYHKKVVERMEPALREEESVLYCGPVKVRLPSHPLGRVRGRVIVTEQRLHTVTRLVQIIQPREQIADVVYDERWFEADLRVSLRGCEKPVEYCETKTAVRRLHRAIESSEDVVPYQG